jgi:hypothetical protein
MFFLIAEKAILATPDSIARSENTVDMTAEQLANDYDTQVKAKMASAVFIKSDSWFPSEPKSRAERLRLMASYLAAFKDDAGERREVLDYISGNGMVRILWLDQAQAAKEDYPPAGDLAARVAADWPRLEAQIKGRIRRELFGHRDESSQSNSLP